MSCAEFLRRDREVAALCAHAVAEIAALVLGGHVGRQFDRVDPEAGVVGIGRETDVIENEELGLGTEIGDVACAGRLHVGDRLLRDAARIAVVGLARGRLENVADDRQCGLGEERVDAGGLGVRHQIHVGFVNRLPAGDRGTVEHHAFGKGVLVEQADVKRDVLPLSARIGETAVDVLDVVVLHELEDVIGSLHGNSPPVFSPLDPRGVRMFHYMSG